MNITNRLGFLMEADCYL